jgi:hypothetical protein
VKRGKILTTLFSALAGFSVIAALVMWLPSGSISWAASTGSPPVLKPIHAVFHQSTLSTLYIETAKGHHLTYRWSLSIPTDPKCAKGFHPNKPRPNEATWYHPGSDVGASDNFCDHSGAYVKRGRVHAGTITVRVQDTSWTCIARYYGATGDNSAVSGDGYKPEPCHHR